MLTGRDTIVAVAAKDLDARTLAVAGAMSPDLVVVRDDDNIVDAQGVIAHSGPR